MIKNAILIVSILFLMSCGKQNKYESLINDPAQPATDSTVLYIDLFHCTHTDFGFTDHPVIVEEIQKRFLDIAIDLALETSKSKQPFCWTAEAMEPVLQWWNDASPDRRKTLIKLIRNKQISINALPMHFMPIIGEEQMKTMTNWVDQDLWKKFQPVTGMQNDVNGFPRAAALELLNHGVKYVWMGINPLNNGSPFKQPTPFWWKMPDDRRILVLNGFQYWEGFLFFEKEEWRSIQIEASNLQYWSPREGDMLQSDEASVRKAHEICINKIKKMKREGYPYDFVTMSITNQWRIDNDGPFTGLTSFIAKWNELGLQPKINLITIDEAMQREENRIGKIIPEYSGEWTDWWSFGAMANPPELTTARQAANYLDAALSPVWGQPDNGVLSKADEINRLLCRYYEHTFASNESDNKPYSIFNVGHLNEKGKFAYHPYEKAKWLLAQRVQKLLTSQPEGLYIINTHKTGYSGWIELDAIAFRGVKYKYVEDAETNDQTELLRSKNTQFWVNNLKPGKIYRYLLKTGDFNKTINSINKPVIETDKNNWPVSVKWQGMEESLFTDGLANIRSLQFKNYNKNRSSLFGAPHFMSDSARIRRLKEISEEIMCTASEKAEVEENEFTVKYTQKIIHPSLNWAIRQVEIYKNEPRVSVNVKFDRISSREPEIIYANFPLPEGLKSPIASCGGIPFELFKDQLPNTCKDYFAIDGWVKYETVNNGSWIWTSRDVPLVAFGTPSLCARMKDEPDNVNNLMAMLYNNLWYTNFLINCPGEMNFKFDLVWRKDNPGTEDVKDIAKSNWFPPVVFRNPPTRANKNELKAMSEVGNY